MSFPNLQVTNSGKAMMLSVLSGAPLVFTKIVLGNGSEPADFSVLNAVQNPQAVGIIDSYERTGTVAKVHWSLNSESVDSSFLWTEYGLYASSTLDENDEVVPGTDVLFSYAFDGTAPQPIASGDSATSIQLEADINIAVGTAENVTAIVSEYSAYASKEEFNAHVASTNNPHRVTASDVGLGNVENHSDTDAVPIFAEAGTLSNILSGEAAGTLWGKVKKLFTSYIAHISSSNPHNITTSKIGAASRQHNHSASDINSGVLNVERGGTGSSSINDFLNATHLADLQISELQKSNGAYDKDIADNYPPENTTVIKFKNGLYVEFAKIRVDSHAGFTDTYTFNYGNNFFKKPPCVFPSIQTGSPSLRVEPISVGNSGYEINVMNTSGIDHNNYVNILVLGWTK